MTIPKYPPIVASPATEHPFHPLAEFVSSDRPWLIHQCDVLDGLRALPDQCIQTVVTSPPYWALRDYGVAGQLGLEATPAEYIRNMVAVFSDVRRVLRNDGTLWLNIGDSYAGSGKGPTGHNGIGDQEQRQGFSTSKGARIGSINGESGHTSGVTPPPGLKPKDLVGIPWMLAFALRDAGWYLRQDIIWSKPNPMPESVTDCCTKAHEYIFLLSKSRTYFYDSDAVREEGAGRTDLWNLQIAARLTDGTPDPGRWDKTEKEPNGRNRRSVWEIATEPYPEAHFATYPSGLVEPCIKAGSREGDLILDPFCGSGTTPMVALRLGRRALGFELNESYVDLGRRRVVGDAPLFNGETS